MITLNATTTTIQCPEPEVSFDEAALAAAAFLARYSGRTLDAYRHDLRGFFQWAVDKQLAVLHATRPHIELYRSAMEQRGLAASTIDRRLSTVCGFYRFAHIDGRISSNPAQYVRRPKVQQSHAIREPRRSTTADGRTSTGTLPTWSSPSSPAADEGSFGSSAGLEIAAQGVTDEVGVGPSLLFGAVT
jgi:hypothetical protein